MVNGSIPPLLTLLVFIRHFWIDRLLGGVGLIIIPYSILKLTGKRV
jgi:hypothetical protein